MPLEDSFLAAIRESPDDDAPRLIYADWLSEQHDEAAVAQGEFVRTQIAMAALEEWTPEWYALRQREQRLQSEFGHAWSKPFRALGVAVAEFERGLPSRIVGAAETLARNWTRLAVIAPGWTGVEVRGREDAIGQALQQRLPASVTHFRIEHLDDFSVDYGPSESRAEAIARSPWIARAESLTVSRGLLRRYAERILAAASAVQPLKLRSLALPENLIEVAGAAACADHPAFRKLRSLNLLSNGLASGWCEALHALDPRTFRSLSVTIQSEAEAAALVASPQAATLESLDVAFYARGRSRPLFDSPRAFPALRRLRFAQHRSSGSAAPCVPSNEVVWGEYFGSLEELEVHGDSINDRTLASIANSPAVAKVRRLRIESREVTDAGAESVAASPHLGALRQIILSGTRVTSAGKSRLRRSPRLAGLLELTES